MDAVSRFVCVFEALESASKATAKSGKATGCGKLVGGKGKWKRS
jgi:hypothetical protein